MWSPAWAMATLAVLGSTATAFLNATETDTFMYLENERMYFAMNKSTSYISTITIDGVSLLGSPIASSTAVLYVDGMVTPKQTHYSPGPKSSFKVVTGTDSAGKKYGGFIVSETAPENAYGEVYSQYWFLREGETSLHSFTRLTYHNETQDVLTPLTELRTLFRPQSPLWTHMSSSPSFWVPEPTPNPAAGYGSSSNQVLVQDTTWYLNKNRTNDPYVTQVADYWTKYSMSEVYRDHTVHGLVADGTQTPDNSTLGVWMVYNTKDTFYGGPTYSDLTVDGYVYNYIMSNHHGDQVVNITNGFERTWGPSLFHFNKGDALSQKRTIDTAISTLRADAETLANTQTHAQFYDDIASYVPGYATTKERGSWKAKVNLPKGASNAIAILTAPGYDYQDNAQNASAYQYWANIASNGQVTIPRVKAGDYRLTMYADGIFGDYVQETISVKPGSQTNSGNIKWVAESAGTELWRIGTPDKSAGEYRHGNALDTTHPLHAPEYRIYWGAYDYINDFPNGVNFHVGKSKEATDFNWVHWAAYGSSMTRPGIYADATINNWTISFDTTAKQLKSKTEATFTVQLAGVTTAAGNTDTYSDAAPWYNLPLVVNVNGVDLEAFVIPFYQSGSCSTRSGVTCYQVANKFTFPASYLSTSKTNELILSLPFNATGSAVVATSISVMYDALRLEVK